MTENKMNLIDQKIIELTSLENQRLKEELVLIASENYPSRQVLDACGSVFSTKYAEGYPGARYYAGCEFADQIEELAISRAKKLFDCEHVNVQPHSGTQANMAVYMSILNPGDRILSMKLDQGGHLSHGSRVNFSGKLYSVEFYGVTRETELIDYEEVYKIAKRFNPKLIVCGASAYSRVIDFAKFSKIAKSVDALLLCDIAHIAGLVAGKVHPTPLPFADFVTTTTHKTLRGPRGAMIMCKHENSKIIDKSVFPGTQGGPFMNMISGKAVAFHEAIHFSFQEYSKQVVKNSKKLANVLSKKGVRIVSGGTDNHQFTIDVSKLDSTGAEIESVLKSIGIVVNKNGIPYDPLPPRVTSGVRLGTPALTSRGMKEDEMEAIGIYVFEAIKNRKDHRKLKSLNHAVNQLALGFDFPGSQ